MKNYWLVTSLRRISDTVPKITALDHIKEDKILATCFATDFFLPEAYEWRKEAWAMMKERTVIEFLVLTKRIDRFLESLPDDWVLNIRKQCIQGNVTFWFKNTGSIFRRDGILENINPFKQTGLAKGLNISILNGEKLF